MVSFAHFTFNEKLADLNIKMYIVVHQQWGMFGMCGLQAQAECAFRALLLLERWADECARMTLLLSF